MVVLGELLIGKRVQFSLITLHLGIRRGGVHGDFPQSDFLGRNSVVFRMGQSIVKIQSAAAGFRLKEFFCESLKFGVFGEEMRGQRSKTDS